MIFNNVTNDLCYMNTSNLNELSLDNSLKGYIIQNTQSIDVS